jgi:hypothetical protein
MEKRRKNYRENAQSCLREIWKLVKHSNMYVFGDPEEETRKN